MKKIAILAADGYEDLELWYPKFRLLEEGFTVIAASPDGKDKVSKHGYPAPVDTSTASLRCHEFAAVIIPGGIKGAENLRMDPQTVRFIKEMNEAGKTIASICHGAWVLISAFIVRERRITCFAGMKDDLIAAGCNYVDQEVAVDNNLITSRQPADLPAFLKEILKKIRNGRE